MGKAHRRKLERKKQEIDISPRKTYNKIHHILRWLPLVALIIFVVIVRGHLLDVPLERDEGGYAYSGQLILKGIPPYELTNDIHLPGPYMFYAVFMAAFGMSAVGIHIGLLIVNIATIILIFYLLRYMFSALAGFVAACTYAILSLSQSVFGIQAHVTHFIAFFVVAGTIILFRAIDKEKNILFFYSGILFGMAFLMKHSGFFFIIFGILYILLMQWQIRPLTWKKIFAKCALYLLGAIMPFVVTCLFLFFLGVFEKFWFWTFTCAFMHASQLSFSEAIFNLRGAFIALVKPYSLIWLIGGLGFICLFVFVNEKSKKYILFIILFLFFSFLSICPGFAFREHYFVTLLPAIALLTGLCVFLMTNIALPAFRVMPILIFVLIFVWSIFQQRLYLFEMSPRQVSRYLYESNPFIESAEIAKYLKPRLTASDYIAVFGSEPEIYFYTNSLSATRYIYTYLLTENNPRVLEMQKEMIREIESKNPKFFIDVKISTSWLGRPDSEKYIFDWAKRYISENYNLVGIVDIFDDITIYKWGKDVENYKPQSMYGVYIYERKLKNS